jgi:hypothetical protein
MAKLSNEMLNRLESLGIKKAKSEDDAKQKVLAKLEENEVQGFGDEDLETMVSILESFVTADDSNDSEESEEDALANESEEGEEENYDLEADEFDEMDRTELKAYIAENSMEVRVKKSWSDDDIRNAIRVEIEANKAEEPEEEDEEETPPPTSKGSKKPIEKEVKKEVGKPTTGSKKEEKTTNKPVDKKSITKVAPKGNKKFDPRVNEGDREFFDVFEKLFPQDKYEWKWMNGGLTVKFAGKNSKKVVCYLTSSSSGLVKVWLPSLIGKTAILDEAGIEFFDGTWNKTPIIKDLEVEESIELIESIYDQLMKVIGNHDAKLGANRAKMEKEMEKGKVDKKQPANNSSKKTTVVGKKK